MGGYPQRVDLTGPPGRWQNPRAESKISLAATLAAMSEGPAKQTHLIRRWEIWVASGAACVVLAAALVWIILPLEYSDGIGLLGVAISAAALTLAVLIFLNQSREAAASERRIIESVAAERAKDAAASDVAAGEFDQYESESRVLDRLGRDVGDHVLRLEQPDIPLRLIKDVVDGWERAGEKGEWTLGTVLAALRKQGKGNHAWWLIFRSPTDNSERIYKVARGGQGVTGITVTLVE